MKHIHFELKAPLPIQDLVTKLPACLTVSPHGCVKASLFFCVWYEIIGLGRGRHKEECNPGPSQQTAQRAPDYHKETETGSYYLLNTNARPASRLRVFDAIVNMWRVISWSWASFPHSRSVTTSEKQEGADHGDTRLVKQDEPAQKVTHGNLVSTYYH